MLVGGDDQLDRYLMRNPSEVFERTPEPSVINTSNPYILGPHLACAAYELPLSYDDVRWWNDEELHDGIRDLVRQEQLRLRRRWRNGRDEPFAHWCGRGYPAREIGLRSGTSSEIRIVDHHAERLIGTVDESRAYTAVHTGAIYLIRGQSFEVVELDLHDKVARVVECDNTTYTQARSDIETAFCAPPSRAGSAEQRCTSAMSRSPRRCSATSCATRFLARSSPTSR